MVALNKQVAPNKSKADAKNRVGRFFSLAADRAGSDRLPSRNRIGEKRCYAYETGSVDTEFEYGPFGERIRETGVKKDAFNFRFSTKYEDAETGLFYYGFRYYDAETGRWLSRDPIEEAGGLNLYGMVGNDPINLWDLLGLKSPFDEFGNIFKGLSDAKIKDLHRVKNEAVDLAALKTIRSSEYVKISKGQAEKTDAAIEALEESIYTGVVQIGGKDLRELQRSDVFENLNEFIQIAEVATTDRISVIDGEAGLIIGLGISERMLSMYETVEVKSEASGLVVAVETIEGKIHVSIIGDIGARRYKKIIIENEKFLAQTTVVTEDEEVIKQVIDFDGDGSPDLLSTFDSKTGKTTDEKLKMVSVDKLRGRG